VISLRGALSLSRSVRVRVGGWTLVETLVVVGIVALLFGVSVPVSAVFVKRAKKLRCISNLRTLHSALASHVLDKGQWPQMEEGKYNFTEGEFFRFWVEATEPYGMNQDSWRCPSDRALEDKMGLMKGEFFGSYVVTRFDKQPSTPYRWNQPWAMERGNFHGKGAHVLMPDGSVQEPANPFHGR
jgi:prepilin-type processing-associated H-X9-DG protein